MAHAFALRRSRPSRPAQPAAVAARRWGRLWPTAGRAWVDLLPVDAPDGLRVLYALLDGGLVEAWHDGQGHVRLRVPR